MRSYLKGATRLYKKPLKSAGFRVLRAPDVPSVLVELGYVSNKQDLASLLSETWRDRSSGERKEKTEWHRVVVFNENIVKVCEQYLRKGAKVYIEGAIQTRKWADASCSTCRRTEARATSSISMAPADPRLDVTSR